ncbi:MAG: hypothetical protein QXS02_04160 [Candidatus Thermoplasmatota archaeon]
MHGIKASEKMIDLSDEEPAFDSSVMSVSEERPSSFIILPKKSFQRLGLRLLIYSIVGLILFYIIPWSMLNGGVVTDHTLKDDSGKFMGDVVSSDIKIADSYYQGGVNMVLTGYILVFILSIIIIITGIIQSNHRKAFRYLSLVNTILSFVVLLGGVNILIGVIRIISLHLLVMQQITQFSFNNTAIGFFPSAYIALVFGIVYVKNGFQGFVIQRQGLDEHIASRSSSVLSGNERGGAGNE